MRKFAIEMFWPVYSELTVKLLEVLIHYKKLVSMEVPFVAKHLIELLLWLMLLIFK
jgi:hypothetical protein